MCGGGCLCVRVCAHDGAGAGRRERHTQRHLCLHKRECAEMYVYTPGVYVSVIVFPRPSTGPGRECVCMCVPDCAPCVHQTVKLCAWLCLVGCIGASLGGVDSTKHAPLSLLFGVW